MSDSDPLHSAMPQFWPTSTADSPGKPNTDYWIGTWYWPELREDLADTLKSGTLWLKMRRASSDN
jgi:hypothetical protein